MAAQTLRHEYRRFSTIVPDEQSAVLGAHVRDSTYHDRLFCLCSQRCGNQRGASSRDAVSLDGMSTYADRSKIGCWSSAAMQTSRWRRSAALLGSRLPASCRRWPRVKCWSSIARRRRRAYSAPSLDTPTVSDIAANTPKGASAKTPASISVDRTRS